MTTAITHDTAAEITHLHDEIRGLLRASLEKAQRIGELLVGQKSNLKHGEFLRWIKANLPFTPRTAQNYMKLYDNRDQLKNANVSHLSGAYALLSAQDDNRTNDAALGGEWHEYLAACKRQLRERFDRLANIWDPDEGLAEAKLLYDICLVLAQQCAELLLYTEAHLGKLLAEQEEATE